MSAGVMIQSFQVDEGGERFIFEEQVPGEAQQDSQLLLDCKLSSAKEEEEREREHSISTLQMSSQQNIKTVQ